MSTFDIVKKYLDTNHMDYKLESNGTVFKVTRDEKSTRIYAAADKPTDNLHQIRFYFTDEFYDELDEKKIISTIHYTLDKYFRINSRIKKDEDGTIINRRYNVVADTVRNYLKSHNIEFEEKPADSGSLYFQLYDRDDFNSCIRISDHAHEKKPYIANFNIRQFSERKSMKDVKALVIRTLDNGFARRNQASLLKKLDSVSTKGEKNENRKNDQ